MNTRYLSAVTLAATALLGAGAAVASSLPVAGAGASGAAPACRTHGLVLWLDTQGSGAAGSIYYRLEFTNLSGRTCTLNGYPRVAAVDLARRQLGSASARFVSHRSLLTLANGDTASAVLEILDVENFPASACRPVAAAGLRVFPPHQTASKVVPFPFRACALPGPLYLTAQAVQPHA